MRKLLTLIVIAMFITSCSPVQKEPESLIVGTVSGNPHAALLELVSDNLKADGYELEIKEYSDYHSPNEDTASGVLDASFFQHLPYMNDANAEYGYSLVSAGGIFIAGPLGIYSGKWNDISALPDGAMLAIPDDEKNESRSLLILQSAGLITLRDTSSYDVTIDDISANPHHFDFMKVPSGDIADVLSDVDAAVIRGGDAMNAGLSVLNDSLFLETLESPYANAIVVNEGNQDLPKIKALVAALRSSEVREYVKEHYPDGSIIIP